MIDKLIGPVSDIVSKLVPDKDLQAKLNHELKTELHKANMAQVEINKIEAGHSLYLLAAGGHLWVGLAVLLCFITFCFSLLLSSHSQHLEYLLYYHPLTWDR